MISGYLKSSGDLNVQSFVQSTKLLALAASNSTSDSYEIPDSAPVKNQLSLNDCVAFSTCGALEILMGLNGTLKDLSRLFIYWNARSQLENSTKVDGGTYIHLAYQSLVNLGVCQEHLFPYDEKQVLVQPSLLAYKEGNDNKINSFYQIKSFNAQRISDIATAIKANHPVSFGTVISKEFEHYNGDINTVFTTPTSIAGSHAMLICGVRNNNKEFLIKNSWGPGWGLSNNPGKAWFTADYLMSLNSADFFVPTLIPNLIDG